MTDLSAFGAGTPDPYYHPEPGWTPIPGEYPTRYEAEEAAADRGSRRQIARLPVGEVRYVQDERTGRWRVEVRE